MIVPEEKGRVYDTEKGQEGKLLCRHNVEWQKAERAMHA